MAAHKAQKGDVPFTTDEIPRFRHARGRAPVPPPRADENELERHLRLARTGELPAVGIVEEHGPSFFDSFMIWFAAVCAAVALVVSALVAGQILQIRRTLSDYVVVVPADQLTPAPEPTE